jgi:hypothetical protein
MILLFSANLHIKEVFEPQVAWHIQNTLPTMVHVQAFRIITCQPQLPTLIPLPGEGLSNSGFKPWEPTPVSSNYKVFGSSVTADT